MQLEVASSLFLYLQRKLPQNFLGSPVDIKPPSAAGCWLTSSRLPSPDWAELCENSRSAHGEGIWTFIWWWPSADDYNRAATTTTTSPGWINVKRHQARGQNFWDT